MKLTPDEKLFLDRISTKLYGTPMKWRIMLNAGLTEKEVFKILEDETLKQRKIKKDAENSLP